MGLEGFANPVEVGRGGFSVVYRAQEVAFDREVAVKVLSARLDEDARRRFERECRAMGALSWHPHVVAVYATGTDETGAPYLVMEFMPGGSLADRMGMGSQPWEAVVQAGVEVADALAAAHAAGVMHRDVKPANVLVDRFGHCKVADFGIATVVDASATVTALVGTVSYMAPEVLRGGPPTAQADTYALGATLYALLTGRAPFEREGDTSPAAVILRATSELAPDLRHHGVPDAVAAAVEWCMAPNPAERPATVQAAADRLRSLLAPGPAVAPASQPSPPRALAPIDALATTDPLGPPTDAMTVAVARRSSEIADPATPPPAAPRGGLRSRRAWVLALGASVAVIAVVVLLAGGDRTEDPASTAKPTPAAETREPDPTVTSTNPTTTTTTATPTADEVSTAVPVDGVWRIEDSLTECDGRNGCEDEIGEARTDFLEIVCPPAAEVAEDGSTGCTLAMWGVRADLRFEDFKFVAGAPLPPEASYSCQGVKNPSTWSVSFTPDDARDDSGTWRSTSMLGELRTESPAAGTCGLTYDVRGFTLAAPKEIVGEGPTP